MAIITLSDKIRFIESTFGSGKLSRNNVNIDVRCPVCDPKDQSKKKLAIHVESGKVHCWVCGYKAHTLVPLIRKYCGFDKLVEYRDKFMTGDERTKRGLFNIEDRRQVELPKDFRLLVTAKEDPDSRAAWRYVLDRGLTERDMWYFKLGISDERRWYRRIIVPSFDCEGRLNYFVARAIDKFRKPKYDNPDFDKLPVIFNELNVDWSRRLVICEGVFDSFKCGDNVVPLLGSDLNEGSALFSAILLHSTPVALALDGNMWETKTPKIAKKLSDYNVDVTLVDVRSFEDPGAASRLQFQQALDSSVSYDWESSFLTRLDRASRITLST